MAKPVPTEAGFDEETILRALRQALRTMGTKYGRITIILQAGHAHRIEVQSGFLVDALAAEYDKQALPVAD